MESKIFYFDDNNKEVEKSKATKSVIQVYKEGTMIQEVWSYLKPEVEEKIETESTISYLNEYKEEVKKEDAVIAIVRTYKEGKLIEEKSYPLLKNQHEL